MVYELFFEDNKDGWGFLRVKGENSNVAYLVKSEIKGVYEIVSFSHGKAYNTYYTKDRLFDKSYSKEGKGRESKKAKDEMRIICGVALNYSLFKGKDFTTNKKVEVKKFEEGITIEEL